MEPWYEERIYQDAKIAQLFAKLKAANFVWLIMSQTSMRLARKNVPDIFVWFEKGRMVGLDGLEPSTLVRLTVLT